MPPFFGYDHSTCGFWGTPWPYQERVGLPRNVSRPGTLPQGSPEEAGSTQPAYGGRVVVVVSFLAGFELSLEPSDEAEEEE